jgi:hypothetical protein
LFELLFRVVVQVTPGQKEQEAYQIRELFGRVQASYIAVNRELYQKDLPTFIQLVRSLGTDHHFVN